MSHPPPILCQGAQNSPWAKCCALEDREKVNYFQQGYCCLARDIKVSAEGRRSWVSDHEENGMPKGELPLTASVSLVSFCWMLWAPCSIALSAPIGFDVEASPEGPPALLGIHSAANSGSFIRASLISFCWMLINLGLVMSPFCAICYVRFDPHWMGHFALPSTVSPWNTSWLP